MILLLKKKGHASQKWQPLSQWLFTNLIYWILIHQGYFFRKIPASYKSQFCTKVHALSLRVTFSAGLFWAKYKDVATIIIETWCKNKLNLTKLNDLCLNSTKKRAKKWWLPVNSNSKALKFQPKIYHFRLSVFAFNFEYFYCWYWRGLPKV